MSDTDACLWHPWLRINRALVCCVISLLLGGCGEPFTKWECQTGICQPATQALNKCVRRADATPFASDSLKAAIWEQCMHEGFKEVPCTAAERTGPDCHFRSSTRTHVRLWYRRRAARRKMSDIAEKHGETAEGKEREDCRPARPDASLTGLRPRPGIRGCQCHSVVAATNLSLSERSAEKHPALCSRCVRRAHRTRLIEAG